MTTSTPNPFLLKHLPAADSARDIRGTFKPQVYAQMTFIYYFKTETPILYITNTDMTLFTDKHNEKSLPFP